MELFFNYALFFLSFAWDFASLIWWTWTTHYKTDDLCYLVLSALYLAARMGVPHRQLDPWAALVYLCVFLG